MEGGNGGGGFTQPSEEAMNQVKEGITLILSRWSALQMAVENEWGGRDSRRKSEELADDIFSWLFYSKEPLYIDDLENLLAEAMLSLNTLTEDGSVEEVAEKVMIMHEECLQGNYASVESLRVNPRPNAGNHIRQVLNDEEDDSSDDDDSSNMMVDEPVSISNSKPVNEPMKAVPDPDGWMVVSSKRKSKRN